ncbi:MAG TPA: hypothetical protein VFQ60_03185 [Patescibacteria group bacterium]|nr:hypothetical protein [Patescibacteria group bacterium]
MAAIKTASTALAGILFLIAFVPYIRAITKKETKPAKASWLIWATLDSITFAGMLVKHTLNGQVLGAIAGAWTVAILALKYGKPGWSKLDKFCLSGAVLGIMLWQLSGDATFGMATSLSVLILAAFPTFKNAWKNPKEENRLAWTLYWLSCIFAMIAIPKWTIADAAQPIAFTFIETVMVCILWIKPRSIKP